MKLSVIIILAILTSNFSALAQDSTTKIFTEPQASELLTKGRYNVSGGNTITTAASGIYTIGGSLGYFIRDELSLDMQLSLTSIQGTTSIFPAIGATYYFSKFGPMSTFLKQSVDIPIKSNATAYGDTGIGVLYLLNENIGFSTIGQLNYPLSGFAPNFRILGNFNIIL